MKISIKTSIIIKKLFVYTFSLWQLLFSANVWPEVFTTLGSSQVESIAIRSMLDPNAVLITEVDIIFVYDRLLLNELPINKKDWYSNKREVTSQYKDNLDVVNIFIPQGFDSVNAILPLRRNEAVKAFVFAYHDDSKASPVEITNIANVKIEIDPFGIRVLDDSLVNTKNQ
ncbi:hypothetical protein N8749_00300 [bacterium]|nr:hypothetical protein [bacterium]